MDRFIDKLRVNIWLFPLLYDYFLQLNTRNLDGDTPFQCALEKKNVICAKILLQNPTVKVDTVDKEGIN